MDEKEEVVIDDYVVQSERVVDYATRFSGISPEDLDPRSSTREKLVHRSATLMKLRHLIDRGCVLVGHGLTKDFRVLNLVPPPDQVIDTVQLFSRPGERKISLRFLASRLLGTEIQQDRHDSIEDARAVSFAFLVSINRRSGSTESTKNSDSKVRFLYRVHSPQARSGALSRSFTTLAGPRIGPPPWKAPRPPASQPKPPSSLLLPQ